MDYAKEVVMNDSKPGEKKRSGRSVILIQITALVVSVFLIAGIVSLVVFNRSLNHLVQRSKEKLIASDAQIICSAHKYVADLVAQIQTLSGQMTSIEQSGRDYLQAIATRTISPTQASLNVLLDDMIEDNLMGIDITMFVIPAISGITKAPLVFMSSEDDLIYKDVPDYISDLTEIEEEDNTPLRARVDDKNTYVFLENGVPEFGLKGPYLVTTYYFTVEGSSNALLFYDFKPMKDEIAAVNDYYRKEKNSVYAVLGVVIGVTAFVLILITFFVLSYLIRKRITRPIDELETAAAKVMEGDLDVEVPIRSGEEFGNLKRAFNEMIRSIRDVITRATGG